MVCNGNTLNTTSGMSSQDEALWLVMATHCTQRSLHSTLLRDPTRSSRIGEPFTVVACMYRQHANTTLYALNSLGQDNLRQARTPNKMNSHSRATPAPPSATSTERTASPAATAKHAPRTPNHHRRTTPGHACTTSCYV